MAAINCVSFNCGSLVTKWPERIETLEARLVEDNVDIAMLQETWLTNKYDMKMSGFTVYRNDRLGRGGVLIEGEERQLWSATELRLSLYPLRN